MGQPASKSFALVSKLAHCWTGRYKVSFVGPVKAPDGDLVGRNILLLDNMSHKDSRRINARVSVHRDATTRTRESEDHSFCPGR